MVAFHIDRGERKKKEEKKKKKSRCETGDLSLPEAVTLSQSNQDLKVPLSFSCITLLQGNKIR